MFSRNWLAKNSMMAYNHVTKNQMTPVVKRAFSQNLKPQASNTGLYILGGIGLVGITLTCLQGRALGMQMKQS